MICCTFKKEQALELQSVNCRNSRKKHRSNFVVTFLLTTFHVQSYSIIREQNWRDAKKVSEIVYPLMYQFLAILVLDGFIISLSTVLVHSLVLVHVPVVPLPLQRKHFRLHRSWYLYLHHLNK
jgi:hypothetical protein